MTSYQVNAAAVASSAATESRLNAIESKVANLPNHLGSSLDEKLAASNAAVQRRLDALEKTIAAIPEILQSTLAAAIGVPLSFSVGNHVFHDALKGFTDSILQATRSKDTVETSQASITQASSTSIQPPPFETVLASEIEKLRKSLGLGAPNNFLVPAASHANLAIANKQDPNTPRKRGPKPGWKKALLANSGAANITAKADLSAGVENAHVAVQPSSGDSNGAPVKRKRGRPRKTDAVGTVLISKKDQTTGQILVKRGRGRPRKDASAFTSAPVATKPQVVVEASVAAAPSFPVKRGRGRPPKSLAAAQSGMTVNTNINALPNPSVAVVGHGDQPVKRGRGRPRKIPRIEASSDVKSSLSKDSMIIMVDPAGDDNHSTSIAPTSSTTTATVNLEIQAQSMDSFEPVVADVVSSTHLEHDFKTTIDPFHPQI
ncbi:hypothetical protein LEN26_007583 [Aphanomyces euteiches]|nr:hypothetical protein LEN26_007583 [Aphanomyces euteiches]KAH9187345.1 hypothetical protein AeNC1_010678 [Aphanomyces euteiches]